MAGRKRIKGIICLVLVLSMLVLPAWADGPLIVSPEDTSVRAGERVELCVRITNNPGVSGASFKLHSLHEDIELVDIIPVAGGSFVKKLDKQSFSWLKGSNIYGDFDLVKLVFEVSEDAFGQYEIPLMLTGGLEGNLTNAASEAVDVVFRTGILTVSKAENPDVPGTDDNTGNEPGDEPGNEPENEPGDAPETEMPGEGGAGEAEDESCDGGDGCLLSYYADLRSDAWYHEAVEFVITEGIMQGVGEGLFAPAAPGSRAMIVTTLYRLSGESADGKSCAFSDVKSGSWYADAVAWAASNGIVEGYGDGIFGPHYAVTREQMAVIFYRWAAYMGMDTSAKADIGSFSDGEKIHSWAKEAMEWACGKGLILGRSGNCLAPDGETGRSEMATLLWRWCTEINA